MILLVTDNATAEAVQAVVQQSPSTTWSDVEIAEADLARAPTAVVEMFLKPMYLTIHQRLRWMCDASA